MKRLAILSAGMLLAGCTGTPTPVAPAAVAPPGVPAGMQYLYGSGEAAAVSVQAWHALAGYAAQVVKARPVDSVVLADGATLADPKFVPCDDKPFAAVFDVDETVLLNLGFEYDDALHPGHGFDAAKWDAWEKTGAGQVSAVPGAVEGVAALRRMGVTVIFNTNRSVANAAQSEKAIDGAGLGPAVHGETLYLAGDTPGGSHKDGRRAIIAGKFCVIAMGGDQLGDFTDLFNDIKSPAARRAATLAPAIAAKWGAGWFALPNPVYGTGVKGGVDDIFPADKRWSPPGDAK